MFVYDADEFRNNEKHNYNESSVFRVPLSTRAPKSKPACDTRVRFLYKVQGFFQCFEDFKAKLESSVFGSTLWDAVTLRPDVSVWQFGVHAFVRPHKCTTISRNRAECVLTRHTAVLAFLLVLVYAGSDSAKNNGKVSLPAEHHDKLKHGTVCTVEHCYSKARIR